jgi:VanZ family protein
VNRVTEQANPAFAGRLLKAVFYLSLGVGCYLAFVPTLPDISVFRMSDVVLHACGFAYLTFALMLAHPELTPIRAAVWMISYGVAIEIVQYFVPERSAELKDLLMDATGLVVGLLVARVGAGRLRRLLCALVDRIRPA